ncbi:MAG: hypothetical protein FJ382_07565 [Verrucomicrobia bacterium]|nr:hypothetical protein [Verrucomicrobiota bacterium]
MSSPAGKKSVSAVSLVVDAILVLGFFAFLFVLLRSHVPSNNKAMIDLWTALGSACMSGVFWLALQMFRAVLDFQRRGSRG